MWDNHTRREALGTTAGALFGGALVSGTVAGSASAHEGDDEVAHVDEAWNFEGETFNMDVNGDDRSLGGVAQDASFVISSRLDDPIRMLVDFGDGEETFVHKSHAHLDHRYSFEGEYVLSVRTLDRSYDWHAESTVIRVGEPGTPPSGSSLWGAFYGANVTLNTNGDRLDALPQDLELDVFSRLDNTIAIEVDFGDGRTVSPERIFDDSGTVTNHYSPGEYSIGVRVLTPNYEWHADSIDVTVV